MKTILSTLLILTGVTSSFAQSMLKVSLTDRRPITVSVDGRHFRQPGESVTVNDLPKGRHYVVVYVSETLRDGRTADGVIWEGKIKTYRGQMSVCTVDPHSREANIIEQDMYNMPPQNNGQQYNNYNLNNYDTRPADNGYNNQPDNSTVMNNQGSNTDNTATDNTPLPDGSPVASPVSGLGYNDEELPGSKKSTTTKTTTKGSAKAEKIKKMINTKSTDTDKLVAAKDNLKNSTITTADVMSLMECFSFESTKLEFAEWAYDKASDKDNYKKVKQKLSMKSYREEMDKFLDSKK